MTSLRSYIRFILQENVVPSLGRVSPEVAQFAKWNGNQMDIMNALGINMSTDLKSSPRIKEILRIAKDNDLGKKLSYHFLHEKGLKIIGKNVWVIIMLSGDKLVPAGTGMVHKLEEDFGDVHYESGAKTHDADQLLIFAENDFESYNFAKRNSQDKKAVFDFIYARFSRYHPGVLKDDKETVMYDFMANYEPPEIEKIDLALEIFGGYMNGKVFFDQSLLKGFTVNVMGGFLDQAKELADKKGFVCVKLNNEIRHKLSVQEKPGYEAALVIPKEFYQLKSS